MRASYMLQAKGEKACAVIITEKDTKFSQQTLLPGCVRWKKVMPKKESEKWI